MLVDKPAGVTSHDVVAMARREHQGKVGHAGTLDPFATGLLIVLTGRATRLQRYLLALPKTYLATARLGWRSSTGDPDGELEHTGRTPADLSLPTGEVTQRVPMTSAVKVGGERLYRKAHRGESVETPERTVIVHRAELLEHDVERAKYEIECGSGTYVRTLIETLGDAYCEELRRTSIGPVSVPGAGQEPVGLLELTSFLASCELDDDGLGRVSNGVAVEGEVEPPSWAPAFAAPRQEGHGEPDGPVRLVHGGSVVAIARPDGAKLHPEVVLV